jgi:hypothetical protein
VLRLFKRPRRRRDQTIFAGANFSQIESAIGVRGDGFHRQLLLCRKIAPKLDF